MSDPINIDVIIEVRKYFFEEDENICWPWFGNIAPNGYPRIKVHQITYKAHRVITLWAAGLKQSPLYALHNCDNPVCMNYKKHLYLGTQQQNVIDSINRGSHDSLFRKGENHPMSILTENDIYYIRSNNGKTHQQLADEFNVTRSLITHIINRNLWKHI